jgi:hypothetical protein
VNPGTLLTDVCHFQHVGIQAGFCHSLTEGGFMHTRGTGTDNDTCQFFLPDGLDDLLLSGLGAHILIIFCMDHARLLADDFHDFFHIYRCGDIASAMTDKNSYSLHFFTSCIV